MTEINLTQFNKSLQEFNSQLPILKNLISALYARSNNLKDKSEPPVIHQKNNIHNTVSKPLQAKAEESLTLPDFDKPKSIDRLNSLLEGYSQDYVQVLLKRSNVSSLEELPQEDLIDQIRILEWHLNYNDHFDYFDNEGNGRYHCEDEGGNPEDEDDED